MLLPVMNILLNQGLVEANDSLEEADGLLTVVDFGGSELIDGLIVGLELARLKEWNGVLDEGHSRKLGKSLVVV